MSNKTAQYAIALAATLVTLVAAGCSDNVVSAPNANAPVGSVAVTDPRAQVLAVPAGGPAQETPGTTSVVKSDISKAQQANAMPMPGQANDHSTLLPKTSPKPAQKESPQQK